MTSLSDPSLSQSVSYSLSMEAKACAFVQQHEPALYGLRTEANHASWALYTRGEEADVTKSMETSLACLRYIGQPEAFAQVSELKAGAPEIQDPILRRQVAVLYKTFFWGSLNPEIQKVLIEKGTRLENLYNSFRVTYQGKSLGNSEVGELYKYTRDAVEAETLWKARHAVGQYRGEAESDLDGKTIAQQIIELVGLRNQLAREAGFADYYAMVLSLGDVEEALLDRLMDGLASATHSPYKRLQGQIDPVAMAHFGISADRVHEPWFQGTHALGSNLEGGNMMRLFGYDADAPFKGRDPGPLLEKTANAMGFSIQPILDKSDLYFDPERPGKTQHWFCFGIDSPHDVRTLENIDPAFEKRMGYAFTTSLHECLGHGSDFDQIDPALPPVLRDHESITTESNAMLIEVLGTQADWFQNILGLSAAESEEASQKASTWRQSQLLCNLRAQLVTIEFERSMYRLSDAERTESKLNALWWDLQEKYLFERRPDGEKHPDWARVPHYAGAPAYYHNYFIAEIRRAQVMAEIKKRFGSLLTPEAGSYLRSFRALGLSRPWRDIIEAMTGQPLGTDALIRELNLS